MKSPKELKKEVFNKLSQYPKIEAFFKDSLEQRMKIKDNWTENALVHNILDDRISQDHPLSELINLIYDDQENFDILKNKLNPKDKEYNNKMHDVLAELNGYYHLKKFGFETIEALREENKQKKPDFSAELEGKKYLFEVKNLRSPFDIQDILWDKCFARRFLHSNVYSKVRISFVASRTWQDLRFRPKKPNDDPFAKTISWLTNVFETIESSNNPISERLLPFEDKYKDKTLKIECNLQESNKFEIWFMFHKALEISSPLIRKGFLFPFAKRVMEKVGDALEQLLEFDRDDPWGKYVLINWHKSPELAMFYEKECRNILSNVDYLVKNISERLFIRLLNHDSLP